MIKPLNFGNYQAFIDKGESAWELDAGGEE